MGLWLFKQEPSAYSYDRLEAEGKTVWDGVSNNLALKHLRTVRKGDKILFYHSGDERRIVGIMQADSDPYPDPKSANKSLVVVDVKPLQRMHRPVTLEEIKLDGSFADWELVRLSRLSVMPVPLKVWEKISALSRT